MKTHYETLGVSKDATREEIKAAFRRLSMETHPDVARVNANAEKFKQISEANAILSNEKARKRYDFELEEATRFGFSRGQNENRGGGGGGGSGFGSHAGRNARPMTSSVAMHILDGVYKPRNLFFGVTLGFAAVALIKSCLAEPEDQSKRTGKKNLVEAWKHPVTGEWRQPAPWDVTYRKLQPTLQLVPRENVRESR